MYEKLIRIFVNKTTLIDISKYSSLYSLKCIIHEKIYSNISFGEFKTYRISFNGKILNNDNISLISYQLDDNSNISVEKKLEGGNWSSLFWLYTIYGICFLLYIVFLLTGLIPVIANLIGSIFKVTIFNIINYFTKGKNDTTTLIMKKIVHYIIYILSFCFTLFFVWSLTAYIVFPFYYFKTNDYCKSGLAAKHVGKVTMFWYMFVYCMYNFIDVVLNQFTNIVENKSVPSIFRTILEPFIFTTEKSWDSSKFIPIKMIPFLGTYVSVLHDLISTIVPIINSALNKEEIESMSCSSNKYIDNVCVLTTLVTKKLIEIDNKLKKKERERDGYQVKTKSNTKQIEKENLEKKFTKIVEDKTLEPIVIAIKSYKLEKVFNLLKYGFCNIKHKNNLKLGNHSKYIEKTLLLPKIAEKFKNKELTDDDINKIIRMSTESEMEKEGVEVDNNTYWFSTFITSMVCQSLEGVNDMTEVLLGVGTADQVENMWKTGVVAGFITIIPFIVDMLWNTP